LRRTIAVALAAVLTSVATVAGPVVVAGAAPVQAAPAPPCAPTDVACLLLVQVQALLAPVTDLVTEVGSALDGSAGPDAPVAAADASGAPDASTLLPATSLTTGSITSTGGLGDGSLSSGAAGPVAPVGEALTLEPLEPPDFGILGFDAADVAPADAARAEDEPAPQAAVPSPDAPDNARALAVVVALSGLLLVAGLVLRKLRPEVLPFT